MFSNELNEAQIERLAILAEEMGEAQQCIGKILRHGYDSYNPLLEPDEDGNAKSSNRLDLERECGDIYEAILLLCRAKDIDRVRVNRRQEEKHKSIQRWLHHQPYQPLRGEG